MLELWVMNLFFFFSGSFSIAVIVTVSCSIYEKDVSVLPQRPPVTILGLFSKAVQSAVAPSSKSDWVRGDFGLRGMR